MSQLGYCQFQKADSLNIRSFESRMSYNGGADKDFFSHIPAIFFFRGIFWADRAFLL
jgi:hypothetical protein